MRYQFETANGRPFSVDCDPSERVLVIQAKAALDRGYDKLLSSLEFKGEELDPARTFADYGIRPEGKDVVILKGDKRERHATQEDEEPAAMRDALEDHVQGDHALFSLEALRDNIKRRREELDRPTFLTKKQREELALKRREEAARAQKERLAEAAATRRQILQEGSRGGRRTRAEAESAQERLERTEALYARVGPQQDALRDAAMRREELGQIREKYLGRPKEKKFIPKPAERFVKFTFDWSEREDTSRDNNPLYARPHEAQMLYGRGFRAGIDAREQAKERIVYEEEVEKRETEKAVEALRQERDRKARRAAAKRVRQQQQAAQLEGGEPLGIEQGSAAAADSGEGAAEEGERSAGSASPKRRRKASPAAAGGDEEP